MQPRRADILIYRWGSHQWQFCKSKIFKILYKLKKCTYLSPRNCTSGNLIHRYAHPYMHRYMHKVTYCGIVCNSKKKKNGYNKMQISRRLRMRYILLLKLCFWRILNDMGKFLWNDIKRRKSKIAYWLWFQICENKPQTSKPHLHGVEGPGKGLWSIDFSSFWGGIVGDLKMLFLYSSVFYEFSTTSCSAFTKGGKRNISRRKQNKRHPSMALHG